MNPLRILIVENQTITAADLEEVLLDAGYQVVVADSYEEAMQVQEHHAVDLAILDMSLTGSLDGIETARALVERSPMPIVYLTATAASDTLSRAQETHPLVCLDKPFRMNKLPQQLVLAVPNVYTNARPGQALHYFVLPIGKTCFRVETDEVVYIQAEDDAAIFYVAPVAYGRDQSLRKTKPSLRWNHLAHYPLTSEFFHLSATDVLNLKYVDRLESDCVFVGSCPISVPEERRKSLMERIPLVQSRYLLDGYGRE